MLFFHFRAKEVSFLACSPIFKNSTTSEAKPYSAAQITFNNHKSASISKETVVNYSMPTTLASVEHKHEKKVNTEEQVDVQSLNGWILFQ